jgi:predicted NACHT family NTPase
MSRGNIKFTALISSDPQEKLHSKFHHKNINFTALISNDFQEKLCQISRGNIKCTALIFKRNFISNFKNKTSTFTALIGIDFKRNLNLTALISNEFRNLVSYFKMKTLTEFLNKYPSTPQSCKLFPRILACS